MNRSDAIFSVIVYVIYLCITFTYQLLIPFGDEPDFGYRLYHLLQFDEQPFFSPYPYVMDLIKLLDLNVNCRYNSSPLGFLSSLEYKSCSQSYYQAFIRTLISGLIILPIFFIYAFRSSISVFFLRKSDSLVTSFYDKTAGLLYSSVFVSFVYYFNVLGIEQFLLLLTVLLVVFIDAPVIVIVFLSMILAIDFGDGLIVSTFVLYYYFSKFVKLSTLKKSAVIILLFCFFIGPSILTVISGVGISSQKVELMSYAYQGADSVADKYPVILRPVITFMTFILYTPHMLKSIAAYIISFYFIFIFGKRIRRKEIFESDKKLIIVSSVTILSFVFMFPGYANAKYYIFLLPMFLSVLIKNISMKDYFVMTAVLHISVISSILLSYLNYYIP
ncbi:putative DUF2029 domain-containing protein [Vibrio crassostreae]|nr:putative DUF2029 domain-containing protein [Vibrio crassostreae]CAK3199782.1 putative DUF2029 domain-containing protein [Vibrio crassostreae]CAK3236910.1 putative DUF2029 domain-containing protein [Vibrio crassostreae]CAK3237179.1 putative DUF2029 domain-containing protein [Vibrio crassostreae]CAK3304161.1 putative DUF2029 domain-containing protein [Vibrio crassostreae]